ncbi:hypothetical protein C8Q77DRAFT_1036044, partial [Trametes polyzona]
HAKIDRYALVSRFNPTRNASSPSTPMQVRNGHFAFGADITGLQTFLPFATMSDWGWKNDSLPAGTTPADVAAYRGVVWDGVQYEFGGPAPVEQWLTANQNRVNLGRVGLLFFDEQPKPENVTEDALEAKKQVLDLWTGTLRSTFRWDGEDVVVQTVAAQESDTIAVRITSPLLERRRLRLFLDFPWNDGTEWFEAPFVGYWNATGKHTTVLSTGDGLGKGVKAEVAHTMDASTFFTSVGGGNDFSITRVSPDAHRYEIIPSHSLQSFSLAIAYSTAGLGGISNASAILQESRRVWEDFWSNYGFVDVLSGSTDSRAEEFQRRIILSQYLLRVNEAGD